MQVSVLVKLGDSRDENTVILVYGSIHAANEDIFVAFFNFGFLRGSSLLRDTCSRIEHVLFVIIVIRLGITNNFLGLWDCQWIKYLNRSVRLFTFLDGLLPKIMAEVFVTWGL